MLLEIFLIRGGFSSVCRQMTMDNSLALARSSARMLRSRIAHNERMIRAYMIEIEELRLMIETLEREMTRADIAVAVRDNPMLSPPALTRQYGFRSPNEN